MADYLYSVEAEIYPGARTNVYRGSDLGEAVRICNFWDGRVDTYFRSTREETALDRAMRRFDEAIDRLRG